MRVGVLGTGVVGQTIATKLVSLNHDVMLGSRSATNEKAATWMRSVAGKASHGTFTDAAAHGEIVFNCTSGSVSLEALRAAGRANLDGKVLIDVSNPLDFSKGAPPSSTHRGEDSVAEQIQREFPNAKVVKTLNTINASVMVDPSRVPGTHDVFLCGNDSKSKMAVEQILKRWFGWGTVLDLGDLTAARGMELYVLFWIRVWGTVGTTDFNVHVVK